MWALTSDFLKVEVSVRGYNIVIKAQPHSARYYFVLIFFMLSVLFFFFLYLTTDFQLKLEFYGINKFNIC